MQDKRKSPFTTMIQELLDAGVRARPGSDPESRGYDPLERFKRVPNHAIFLYTSEDAVLDQYIRHHWAALDGLSGEACDIHVSVLQLAGGEDAYSQLFEVNSIVGLKDIKPTDLPALHIWSSNTFLTVHLHQLDSETKLRDLLRRVFSRIHDASGPISLAWVEQMRLDLQTVGVELAHLNNGQKIAGSTAGRDIIQITYTHPNVTAPREKKMANRPGVKFQQSPQS
jgi:hypothetical protein